MNIPFEEGQKVFIVYEDSSFHYEHVAVGCDHLGPIGQRQLVVDHRCFKVKEESFRLKLLAYYSISNFYSRKEDAENKARKLNDDLKSSFQYKE